ncbi:hypothetical protein [Clostridium sp. E02]|uniref:hypothetical protein n=1 Tax=Clostridium sp. E02 TaxID=2487134 RepID=UPI000F5267CF|nr:hypothetical protein [Clostridium sp. E02]
MKYLILVILLNCMLWPLISSKGKVWHILKALVACFGLFITEYTIVSSVLLYFNLFEVKRVLIIVLFIQIGGYVLVRPSLKLALECLDFDLRKHLEIILLVMCLLPIIVLKSVPIAPLFDAGVYGAKTLDLISEDNTSNIKTLGELEVANNSIKEELLTLQKTQAGIYLFPVNSQSGDMKYEYHGLPTWPAMMALSAKIGGIRNMSQILTPIFILICLTMYFFLDSLKLPKKNRLLSVLIFGASPLVLYLAKLPLSELFITALTFLTLFLLSMEEDVLKIFAGLSLGAMCLSHLSLFMYMPIIFISLLVLCEMKNNKVYGIVNIISNGILMLSLFYANKVTSLYTDGQLGKMFGHSISIKNIIGIIIIGALFFIVIQITFMFIKYNNILKRLLRTFLESYINYFIIGLLISLGIFTIYQSYILGFTDKLKVTDDSWRFRALYINKGIMSLKYLNIVNIIMASSYVAFPLVVWNMVRKKGKKIEAILMELVLIYSLAIYTILRCDSPINYSSSRYFVPFIIPMIVLLLAVYVVSKKQIVIISCICVLTSLPFNLMLAKTNEYYGNIQFMEDISMIVGKQSWVFINPEETFVSYQLTTNLREYNDNKVFDLDSVDKLRKYSDVQPMYVITMNEINNEKYEKILEKKYPIVGELYSLNVIYPLTVGKAMMQVYVYKIIST